tara:strand:- start:762 stop:1118 length:357 start_codon:yes stop_codon:yes gene_type:complete
MAGFLSDTVISTAYNSLIFRKGDNKLYYDNGTADVEVLDLTGLTGMDADVDGRFEFDSANTFVGALTSGNLAEFANNGTIKFSIDYDGVVKLNELSSQPSNPTNGDLAFISGELYIAK